MFSEVVTIEEDAKQVYSGDDVAFFAARVSYRTEEHFQALKNGEQEKSWTQFADCLFKVFKRKKEGVEGKVLPIEKEALTKGTMAHVEGSIGQDVQKGKKDAEKIYYALSIKATRFRLVGKRPERTNGNGNGAEAASAPAEPKKAAGKKEPVAATKLEPRKVQDPGDATPEEYFY